MMWLPFKWMMFISYLWMAFIKNKKKQKKQNEQQVKIFKEFLIFKNRKSSTAPTKPTADKVIKKSVLFAVQRFSWILFAFWLADQWAKPKTWKLFNGTQYTMHNLCVVVFAGPQLFLKAFLSVFKGSFFLIAVHYLERTERESIVYTSFIYSVANRNRFRFMH